MSNIIPTHPQQAQLVAALRHRCRNPRCRLKLPTPVENEHRAFCCRGCFGSFYRARCLVCERDLSTNPITGERRKRLTKHHYCGRKCRNEAARFPHVFRWEGISPKITPHRSGSARFTGLKNGHESHLWWWGGDPESGDHSFYDRNGLTIARFVLESDGRYHLRTPVAIPRMSWADLDEAKHRAAEIALAALPLDPKTAARIQRDNETPHPMGRPLNRPSNHGDGVLLGANSKIAFKTHGPWSDDLNRNFGGGSND